MECCDVAEKIFIVACCRDSKRLSSLNFSCRRVLHEIVVNDCMKQVQQTVDHLNILLSNKQQMLGLQKILFFLCLQLLCLELSLELYEL